MRSNYKRLGDYIKECKTRNSQLKATNLLGINIDKFFMPSVANVVGTDLSSYKIVSKNQFAFGALEQHIKYYESCHSGQMNALRAVYKKQAGKALD